MEGDHVVLPGGHVLDEERLRKMIRHKDSVFIIEGRETYRVEVRNGRRYYKLWAPITGRAPTLEISGVHMHRIVEVDPWTDSLMKVNLARVRAGARVLDVCTGLGYTAIASRLRGARYVLTIEKDENVLKIAKANPWSRRLADPQVDIILGDAVEVLPGLPSGSFHVIVHDPPRLSLAGELYSLEFYRELYRVLRRRGILFHYTGNPGGKYRRLNIAKGVAQRLRAVGFKVAYAREALGVIGFK